MIGQVINITGIQLNNLKSSEAEALPKLLPLENSLVEVSVLDKPNQSGTYRLLIEGNVFQSKLPLSLNPGEVLLAKVIGLSPFTVSLDNIFQAKILSGGNAAAVLSKLGLIETEVSTSVIKAFLKENKPLVKSKLKKIIDLLEKEDVKLDEKQLGLFIQMVHVDENRNSFLKKSFAKLFEHPVESLAGEIFNSVKRLNSMGIPEEILSGINRALVLDAVDMDSFSAISLKEKAKAKIDDFIGSFTGSEVLSENAKQELQGLKEILIRFNVLRACHLKTGESCPGFFIVKSDSGEFELVEYSFENSTSEGGQKSHKIKLEMNPASLGKVTVNGFLSGTSLSASFGSAMEGTIEKLNAGKEELLKAFSRINVQPKLSFGNSKQTGEVSNGSMRQINVRL